MRLVTNRPPLPLLSPFEALTTEKRLADRVQPPPRARPVPGSPSAVRIGLSPGALSVSRGLALAHLSHLTLTNFRNFIQLELDLNPGVCVFFGANAQGKTTLLEAVYLLAIARSFRAENEREVVNFGAALQGEPALVGGAIEKREERLAVYIGYQPQPVRGATSAGSPRSAAPKLTTSRSFSARKERAIAQR